MSAKLRPAVMADLDALLRLEEAAFSGDRLTRAEFRRAIRSHATLTLAAGPPGALSGYLFMQTRRGSRLARITSLAVDADHVGQGLGRRLVEAAEDAARRAGCDRMRLEVRADNARAARLYERGGYREYDHVADYYEDGETARCFEKALG